MTTRKRSTAATPTWLIARQTLTIDTGDGGYPVLAGITRVPSDHAAAKARPDLFAPDDTEGSDRSD
jgi:hypothetical protein